MGTIVTDIAQAMPDCQLIEIPDASHDLPNENPQEFFRALRAYLIEPPAETEP
jgi:pimeloyl-ACP methyl ester carboxylesterase